MSKFSNGLLQRGIAIMEYVPEKEIEKYNELNLKLIAIAEQIGVTIKVPMTSRDIKGGYGFNCADLVGELAKLVEMSNFQSTSMFSAADELQAFVQGRGLRFNHDMVITVLHSRNINAVAAPIYLEQSPTAGDLDILREVVMNEDYVVPEKIVHGYARATIQAQLIINGRDDIVVNTPRELVRAIYVMNDLCPSMKDKLWVGSMTRVQRRTLTRIFESFVDRGTYAYAPDAKDLKRIFHSMHIGELTKCSKMRNIARLVRQDKCVSFDADAKRAIADAEQGKVMDLLKLTKQYPSRVAGLVSVMSAAVIGQILDSILDNIGGAKKLSLLELAKSRSSTGPSYTLPSANNPHVIKRDTSDDYIDWIGIYETISKNVGQSVAELMGITGSRDPIALSEGLKSELLDKAIIETNRNSQQWSRGCAYDLPVSSDNVLTLCQWWLGYGDVDLSLCVFDEMGKGAYVSNYQNYEQPGMHHSIDVRNAPNGAAEYINVYLDQLPKDVRYGVLVTSSYDAATFDKLEESWVGIGTSVLTDTQHVDVINRVDVNQPVRNSVIGVVDFKEMKIIWLDVPYSNPMSYGVTFGCNCVTEYLEMALELTKSKLTKYDVMKAAVEAAGCEEARDGVRITTPIADSAINRFKEMR